MEMSWKDPTEDDITHHTEDDDAKISTSIGGQWSELLDEMLDQIKKPLSLPDAIRFASVCSSWRSVTADSTILHHKGCLPWLIVPYLVDQSLPAPGTEDNYCRDSCLGFFSILDGVVYKVETPELYERRICGASHGWLVTLHSESSEMQLFHPLSKNIVRLPPLTTFPRVKSTRTSEDGSLVYQVCYSHFNPNNMTEFDSNYMRDLYIYKVIASPHPHSSVPPVVIAIPYTFKYLYFCRPGKDESWTRIGVEGRYNYSDVTFYKGVFYALGCEGELDVLKGLDGPSPTSSLVLSPSKEYTAHDMLGPNSYLVVSSDELLQVVRHFGECISDEDGDHRFTERFHIFKLDLSGPKWVELKHLDGRALFVGFNDSFSVIASEFPGCQGNCIYFSDDDTDSFFTGHDKGVYSLENSTIGTVCPMDVKHICPRPLWYSANPR